MFVNTYRHFHLYCLIRLPNLLPPQELEALRSELAVARAEQAALVAEKAAYVRQALVEQQSGADEQTARQRHLEGR